MLPLLHTPGFVVQKLQGGADLMTPGLQHGPPFPKKAKKGAIVAIASLENPSVPVAVGVCEIDVSALGSVQGAKGHAVQTMHWAGDEVWSYSTSGKSGMNPPEEIDGWLRDDHDQGLAGQAGELKLEDEDEEGGGVSLGENDANARATEVSPTDEEDEPAQEEDSAKAEVKQMSTKGIHTVRSLWLQPANPTQKSTMPFITLSCMVFTITRRATKGKRTLGSTSLLLSLP